MKCSCAAELSGKFKPILATLLYCNRYLNNLSDQLMTRILYLLNINELYYGMFYCRHDFRELEELSRFDRAMYLEKTSKKIYALNDAIHDSMIRKIIFALQNAKMK